MFMGTSITFLCLCVVVLSRPRPAHQRPWENKGFFEGDIILNDIRQDRSAVPDPAKLWPGGTVYYRIAPNLESSKSEILGAMKHIEDKTCIKFEEGTNQKSQVIIIKDHGCFSHVGKANSLQPLSLGDGCMVFGTIVHELVHAIGFYHEHTRSDRDDYIEINWGNIKSDHWSEFRKLSPIQNKLLNSFDYDSIMMYGKLAFAVDDESPTMEPLKSDVKLLEVNEKDGLSPSDIYRINELYECNE